eukprot:GEMP01000311.1.p1 GENE.GEMP01000311.1~~GEMP01000311.1.p1  ORF type:complete len:1684 (+),score=570.60 GEMP01000311.1:495-5054(+)
MLGQREATVAADEYAVANSELGLQMREDEFNACTIATARDFVQREGHLESHLLELVRRDDAYTMRLRRAKQAEENARELLANAKATRELSASLETEAASKIDVSGAHEAALALDRREVDARQAELEATREANHEKLRIAQTKAAVAETAMRALKPREEKVQLCEAALVAEREEANRVCLVQRAALKVSVAQEYEALEMARAAYLEEERQLDVREAEWRGNELDMQKLVAQLEARRNFVQAQEARLEEKLQCAIAQPEELSLARAEGYRLHNVALEQLLAKKRAHEVAYAEYELTRVSMEAREAECGALKRTLDARVGIVLEENNEFQQLHAVCGHARNVMLPEDIARNEEKKGENDALEKQVAEREAVVKYGEEALSEMRSRLEVREIRLAELSQDLTAQKRECDYVLNTLMGRRKVLDVESTALQVQAAEVGRLTSEVDGHVANTQARADALDAREEDIDACAEVLAVREQELEAFEKTALSDVIMHEEAVLQRERTFRDGCNLQTEEAAAKLATQDEKLRAIMQDLDYQRGAANARCEKAEKFKQEVCVEMVEVATEHARRIEVFEEQKRDVKAHTEKVAADHALRTAEFEQHAQHVSMQIDEAATEHALCVAGIEEHTRQVQAQLEDEIAEHALHAARVATLYHETQLEIGDAAAAYAAQRAEKTEEYGQYVRKHMDHASVERSALASQLEALALQSASIVSKETRVAAQLSEVEQEEAALVSRMDEHRRAVHQTEEHIHTTRARIQADKDVRQESANALLNCERALAQSASAHKKEMAQLEENVREYEAREAAVVTHEANCALQARHIAEAQQAVVRDEREAEVYASVIANSEAIIQHDAGITTADATIRIQKAEEAERMATHAEAELAAQQAETLLVEERSEEILRSLRSKADSSARQHLHAQARDQVYESLAAHAGALRARDEQLREELINARDMLEAVEAHDQKTREWQFAMDKAREVQQLKDKLETQELSLAKTEGVLVIDDPFGVMRDNIQLRMRMQLMTKQNADINATRTQMKDLQSEHAIFRAHMRDVIATCDLLVRERIQLETDNLPELELSVSEAVKSNAVERLGLMDEEFCVARSPPKVSFLHPETVASPFFGVSQVSSAKSSMASSLPAQTELKHQLTELREAQSSWEQESASLQAQLNAMRTEMPTHDLVDKLSALEEAHEETKESLLGQQKTIQRSSGDDESATSNNLSGDRDSWVTLAEDVRSEMTALQDGNATIQHLRTELQALLGEKHQWECARKEVKTTSVKAPGDGCPPMDVATNLVNDEKKKALTQQIKHLEVQLASVRRGGTDQDAADDHAQQRQQQRGLSSRSVASPSVVSASSSYASLFRSSAFADNLKAEQTAFEKELYTMFAKLDATMEEKTTEYREKATQCTAERDGWKKKVVQLESKLTAQVAATASTNARVSLHSKLEEAHETSPAVGANRKFLQEHKALRSEMKREEAHRLQLEEAMSAKRNSKEAAHQDESQDDGMYDTTPMVRELLTLKAENVKLKGMLHKKDDT